MRGHRIRFSATELAWLKKHRRLVMGEYHSRFCKQFDRTDVGALHLHGLRKRKGWKTGRTGRFVKGQEPPNKGVRCPEGRGGRHPNSRKTHFKKGFRGGVAAQRYKPIGAERVSRDGYRERKIHDGLPMQSRWRLVHLIEWEAANGPVPEGHALKCLDGNRLNTDPRNWEPIPRALLPRLAGRWGRTPFDDAPDELKPTILAAAKLEHQVRLRRQAR